MTRAAHVIPNLPSADPARSAEFYRDFLGMLVEDLGLGWIQRVRAVDSDAMLQVLQHDATAPETPVVTIQVLDVDQAYADAQRRGLDIVRPLSTEEWGVRRFLVRDPDGNVLNIAQNS